MLSDEEVGDEKIETFEPLISGDFSPGGNADSASNPVLGSSLDAQRCTRSSALHLNAISHQKGRPTAAELPKHMQQVNKKL